MTDGPVRIGGVLEGRVYGFDTTDILLERPTGEPRPAPESLQQALELSILEVDVPDGRLPTPDRTSLMRRLSAGRFRPVVRSLVGNVATATLSRVAEEAWLATVDAALYTSHDGGRSWRWRHDLPASSGPMGVLPTAVCATDNSVYVGEYPLGDEVPRVLASSDDGRTWSTRLRLPDIRHVHAVQQDPFTGDIWVTTGDANDECSIGRLRNGTNAPTFERIGGGSQQWRAVELAFTPSAVLWGMDSAYADHNRLYRIDRDSLETTTEPRPIPVGETRNSVYYATSMDLGDEYWVVFSTAVETGRDRSAPGRPFVGDDTARVVAASSRTNFTDWHVLLQFQKQSCVFDAMPRLPSANAYVYLATHPELGLVVNPFNTRSANGMVLTAPQTEVRSVTDP